MYSEVEVLFETIVDMEKIHVLHILSVCVCVALVIQHAKRMRSITYIGICGLSGCIKFSTLSHKLHDFRKTFYGT